MDIIAELKWRKILKDISNEAKIKAAVATRKGIYCGFDPTNDSLHLGNLLQIILLRRFALIGLQPIAIIGGATAMIGDPSGKNQERNLLSKKQLQANIIAISAQLSNLVNEQNSEIDPITLLSMMPTITSEIITKIKTNQLSQEELIHIYQTLPLPLAELNLELTTMLTFLSDCQFPAIFTTIYQLQIQPITDPDSYLSIWSKSWVVFMQMSWGQSKIIPYPIKINNNKEWLSNFNFLQFLREVGKNFNLNQMLRKEMIASRLETGISYTEFSYMLLQAYDFYYLYTNHNCYLQSGGSDQWGNITAGLDLIKKLVGETPAAGLTINLLTKADGSKFGKSEKGAIFLDAKKTTIYQFYQFLFNQDDNDLEKLLATLTFLTEKQIKMVLVWQSKYSQNRIGQKLLAALLTSFVHKVSGLMTAFQSSQLLFKEDFNNLKLVDIQAFFQNVPNFIIKNDMIIIDVLVSTNIAKSKKIARELLSNNAIMVNGKKIINADFVISKAKAVAEKVTILKKGKKQYYLIKHEY